MQVSQGKGVTWINQRNRESRGITCSSNSSSTVSLFTEIGSINVILVCTNSGPILYRSTRVVGEELLFFKNFRAYLSLKFNDLTDAYLKQISYQWSLVWIKFRIWLFKWQLLMTIALMKWQLVLSSHGKLALKKNFRFAHCTVHFTGFLVMSWKNCLSITIIIEEIYSSAVAIPA